MKTNLNRSRQSTLDLQAINRIVADQTKSLRAQVESLESALTSVRDIAIAMDDSQRSYPAPTVILAEGGDRIKRIANMALNPSLYKNAKGFVSTSIANRTSIGIFTP